MSTERVDKAWQSKGLQGFSTEAILGTLGHYGVSMSEADFRQLAETTWPSDIATQWGARWKGTGPFKPFPFAAAEELWRRWVPHRLAPREFSESLAGLMDALSALLQGSPQAPVGPAFERMNAARQRVPLDEKGLPQLAFIERALAGFDQKAAERFDSLAEGLAKAGHVEHAQAFAEFEEFILPDRRGIATAIVRAVKGEREPALADLVKVSTDASRGSLSRLLAVDGLVHLGAYPQAATHGRTLMEEAERGGDLHLALDLCARLEHVYRATGDRAALQALAQDAARLEDAHDRAHPGHRRHRH